MKKYSIILSALIALILVSCVVRYTTEKHKKKEIKIELKHKK